MKQPNNTQMGYQYDGNGNRTYQKHAFDDVNYTYDTNSDRLTQLTDGPYEAYKTMFEYDKNGNLTKKTRTIQDKLFKQITYTWNAQDQLVKADVLVSGNMNPVTVLDAIYDYKGERTLKRTPDGIEQFIYGAGSEALTITDGDGRLKEIYVTIGGKKVLSLSSKDGSMLNLKKRYYFNDVLGSPVVVTDEEGTPVQQYIWGAFGEFEFKKTETDNYGLGGTRYQYTGHDWDEVLELNYCGARYYDPQLGRFISEDPASPILENPQTLNRYVYCLNNPLIYTDPTGAVFGWDDLVAGICAAVTWICENWLVVSAGVGVASGIDAMSNPANEYYGNFGAGFMKGFGDASSVIGIMSFTKSVVEFFGKNGATVAQQAVGNAGDDALKDGMKNVDPKSGLQWQNTAMPEGGWTIRPGDIGISSGTPMANVVSTKLTTSAGERSMGALMSTIGVGFEAVANTCFAPPSTFVGGAGAIMLGWSVSTPGIIYSPIGWFGAAVGAGCIIFDNRDIILQAYYSSYKGSL